MINLKRYLKVGSLCLFQASRLELYSTVGQKWVDAVLKSKHDFSARNPHDFGPVLTPSVNLHYFNVALAYRVSKQVLNTR